VGGNPNKTKRTCAHTHTLVIINRMSHFTPNSFDGLCLDGLRDQHFDEGTLTMHRVECWGDGTPVSMPIRFQSAPKTHGNEFTIFVSNINPRDISKLDLKVFRARFLVVHIRNSLGHLVDVLRAGEGLEAYQPDNMIDISDVSQDEDIPDSQAIPLVVSGMFG